MDLFSLLALLTLASAAPPPPGAQFCRLGLPSATADFCLAITQYHNHSSAAHDLYLRLSIRRPSSSAHLGWTAVAIGHRMQDALMFIVYGDPATTPPILSVRTTTQGHSAPVAISADSVHSRTPSIDPRILDATWSSSPDSASTTADLSAVIYGYSRWPAIATSSPSLPWLWAFNNAQDLSPYLPSSPLSHHDLSTTGFGSFYVDMRSASTHHAPSVPTLHPSLANSHASETPLSVPPSPSFLHTLSSRPLLTLHALLMATAFLLLFPLGAISIRSRSPSAFRTHWCLQAAATATALAAALAGMLMADWHLLASPHQIAGSAISCALLLQPFLGWRHHVDFLRLRRRTAISYAHIALGFAILVAGWLNLLSGILLAGSRRGILFAVACLVFLEAAAVTAWALLARRRGRADAAAKESPESSAAYFALDDLGEDEEGEDEGLIKGSTGTEY